MDDYDTKSLEELRAIARAKYAMEIPAQLQLGDAIEWLRVQDALAETRIEAALEEQPGAQVIIPKEQNPPRTPGPLPVIAPLIPTAVTIPIIPTIPGTVPTAKLVGVRYFLNDENTLRALHGTPALSWETDFATLNDVRNQQGIETANPDAAFQARVLHPDYQRLLIRAPTPTVRLGVPTIPVIPGLAQPTVPTVPIPAVIIPAPSPRPPTIPVAIPLPPAPVVTIPVPVPAPTIPVPAITLPLPRPIIPTTTAVPVPATPPFPITRPTIPLPAPTVPVPRPIMTVAAPTVPVPRPIVLVPAPTVPVPRPIVLVPAPAVPTARPVVPAPIVTVPAPAITVPIPRPATTITIPIPRPAITVPAPAVTVPRPVVTMTVIPPPAPRQMTLTIQTPGPVVPMSPKPLVPQGRLIPTAPVIAQAPVTPGFQAGAQIAGFTTIRATTLIPTIPNVTARAPTTPPAFITPAQTTGAATPRVQMPTFNTAVAPVTTPVRRPSPLPVTPVGARLPPAPGTTESIIAVLNEIDPNLLVPERTGKNKKGYRLETLQGFAQRLGLTVSGKRKQELIDDIQAIRREVGLI